MRSILLAVILATLGCGGETQVIEGSPCVTTDMDGCVQISCPGSESVEVCNGADGAMGEPGSQGLPGADGSDGAQGPQGVPGPPGQDGADAANPAITSVDVFELENLNSPYRDVINCSFSDDVVFASDYTPLDVAEGQQVLVHTQFRSLEGYSFSLFTYMQPAGTTQQQVHEIYVDSPVSDWRTINETHTKLTLTDPLAAGQYTVGVCIQSYCPNDANCNAAELASALSPQVVVMGLRVE